MEERSERLSALNRRALGVGSHFGRLSVVKDLGSRGKTNLRASYSLVRCDCGNEFEVRNAALLNGNTKSCGCLRNEIAADRERKPLKAGQRFGRFTVVRNLGSRQRADGSWRMWSKVRCECGAEREIMNVYLLTGQVISCGCLRVEMGRRNGRARALQMQFEEGPWTNTKPELAVKAKLDAWHIRYIHPFSIHGHFLADFYLPDRNLVIEVDGCWWHGCERCGFAGPRPKQGRPSARAKTRTRNAYIRAHGYRLLVVPEHEAPGYESLEAAIR
jgi:G:T-mismatch repair DNA endonuclease (very short patch repair protein)